MRKILVMALFTLCLAGSALLHGCGKKDGAGVGGKVIITGSGN